MPRTPEQLQEVSRQVRRHEEAIDRLALVIPSAFWEERAEKIIDDKLSLCGVAIKYLDSLRKTTTTTPFDYPEYFKLSHNRRIVLAKQMLIDMLHRAWTSTYTANLGYIIEECQLTVKACETASDYISNLKETQAKKALKQRLRRRKRAEDKKAALKANEANEAKKARKASKKRRQKAPRAALRKDVQNTDLVSQAPAFDCVAVKSENSDIVNSSTLADCDGNIVMRAPDLVAETAIMATGGQQYVKEEAGITEGMARVVEKKAKKAKKGKKKTSVVKKTPVVKKEPVAIEKEATTIKQEDADDGSLLTGDAQEWYDAIQTAGLA